MNPREVRVNKWLAVLLSLLALGLAACGGDDEEGQGGAAGNTETPVPESGGDAVQVGMENIEYVPQEVRVKAGGTVRWTNSDSLTHTVTKREGPGPKFDSGNMAVGDTYEQRFEEAGKVEYFCTIHPNQTGTVTVE